MLWRDTIKRIIVTTLLFVFLLPTCSFAGSWDELRTLKLADNSTANVLISTSTNVKFYYVGLLRNNTANALGKDMALYEKEDKSQYIIIEPESGYVWGYYNLSDKSTTYKWAFQDIGANVEGLGSFGKKPEIPSIYYIISGRVTGTLDINDFADQAGYGLTDTRASISFRIGEGGPWISQADVMPDGQFSETDNVLATLFDYNSSGASSIRIDTTRNTKIQVYAWYKDVNGQIWEGKKTVDTTADFRVHGSNPDGRVYTNAPLEIAMAPTTTPEFTEQATTTLTSTPLDTALSAAIGNMIKFVNSTTIFVVNGIDTLLDKSENYVLGWRDDPSTSVNEKTLGVEPAWTKMRNIGLTLLIMALIIIAFANVLQIDIEHYGLNRMIPKIIISIIMAYLSWIIVTFFFDLSRALQDQAIGLIGSAGAGPTSYLAGVNIAAPSGANAMGQFGALLLLVALVIGVLICGLILYFTLILRIVVLSFLLAVAPLAFILNIVPFTSKLYKQWWSEFFKWMFMGPIAVVVLALGSIIASSATLTSSKSLSASDAVGTTGGNMMIGLLIYGACMYFAATLPQKWGGGIMKGWSKAGKGLEKWAGKTSGISGAGKLISDRYNNWSNNRSALAANKLARLGTFGKVGTTADVLKRQQYDAAVTETGKQIGVSASNDYVLSQRYAKANKYEKAAIDRELAGRGSLEKAFAAEHIDPETGTFYDKKSTHWGPDESTREDNKKAAERAAKIRAGEHLVELAGSDMAIEKAVKDNQGELLVAAACSDSKYFGNAKANALKGGFLAGNTGKPGNQKRTQAIEFLEGKEATDFISASDVKQILGKDGDNKRAGHLEKDLIGKGKASQAVIDAFNEIKGSKSNTSQVQNPELARMMAEDEQAHRANMDEIRRRSQQ